MFDKLMYVKKDDKTGIIWLEKDKYDEGINEVRILKEVKTRKSWENPTEDEIRQYLEMEVDDGKIIGLELPTNPTEEEARQFLEKIDVDDDKYDWWEFPPKTLEKLKIVATRELFDIPCCSYIYGRHSNIKIGEIYYFGELCDGNGETEEIFESGSISMDDYLHPDGSEVFFEIIPEEEQKYPKGTYECECTGGILTRMVKITKIEFL